MTHKSLPILDLCFSSRKGVCIKGIIKRLRHQSSSKIYTMIQEEKSIFWEAIVQLILKEKFSYQPVSNYECVPRESVVFLNLTCTVS